MESNDTKVLQLPNELWCKILCNVLFVRDKVKCRLICKQLRFCVDGASWKYAYLEIVAKNASIFLKNYNF